MSMGRGRCERWKMEDSSEEFEPLFDYSRVQPLSVVSLDDDDSNSALCLTPKRAKISTSYEEKNEKVAQVIIGCEEKEEEDWLPPPPKVSVDVQNELGEDSTIKQMRLRKQELLSFTQSAEDVLRAVEESAKRELGSMPQSSVENATSEPPKPPERAKIVISIQDKDALKQFRIYMDDKFERLFKMYADKFKLDLKSLIFCFDGDKISPTATPDELGLEDNDIIEVHIKSS